MPLLVLLTLTEIACSTCPFHFICWIGTNVSPCQLGLLDREQKMLFCSCACSITFYSLLCLNSQFHDLSRICKVNVVSLTSYVPCIVPQQMHVRNKRSGMLCTCTVNDSDFVYSCIIGLLEKQKRICIKQLDYPFYDNVCQYMALKLIQFMY